MALTSLDITSERMETLGELFPEAFTEGKVDFGRLKEALGEFADDSPERYGLSWAGKAEAKRAFQSLSSGTLVPLRDESVNFDTTENLVIEGDNLEVLKLLQKSYFGKVKMIYIDPPYNTGNEFIYPDDYREGLDGYLRYSGQVTDDGVRVETNAETSGRFHSKWLNMMYPRLFLARNLLRADGVILVSIDDHECNNLRLLMNDVFGDENFLALLPTVMNLKGNQDEFGFAGTHEYTIVFAMDKTQVGIGRFALAEEEQEEWDEDEVGPYKQGANLKATGRNAPRSRRPHLWFPLYVGADDSVRLERHSADDTELVPITNGEEMSWRWSRKRFLSSAQDVIVVRNGREIALYKKQRPSLGDLPSRKPKSLWYKPEYSSGNGTNAVKELFGVKLFDVPPKPPVLIRDMVEIGTAEDDVVLDFFAGSGTTAQAVLQLNSESGGRRKFILVQLPEPTPADSGARKAGYSTIADVCRERVRRVIKKLDDEDNSKLDLDEPAKQDRGFRAFRLTSSNFKLWNSDETPTDEEGRAEQLRLYADHVLPGGSQEDILYELLLKAGVPLGAKIEKVEVAGRSAFDVSVGLLLICLEGEVTEDTLHAMIERKPEQVLCLDNAFKGNDQLKTNAVLEMQSHDIKFHTV